MNLQALRERVVAMLSTTLQQVIQLLVRRLEGRGLTWALTGSASFALHGMDLPVHDIDVQTDKKSAYGVEAALVEYFNAAGASRHDIGGRPLVPRCA